MTTVKYPQVQVRLAGEDGNAFSILGRTMKALRRAGVTSDEVTAYHEEATTGDYGHLLRTTMQWVNCDAEEETVCGSCNYEEYIYADGMCEDCWNNENDDDDEEEN